MCGQPEGGETGIIQPSVDEQTISRQNNVDNETTNITKAPKMEGQEMFYFHTRGGSGGGSRTIHKFLWPRWRKQCEIII